MHTGRTAQANGPAALTLASTEGQEGTAEGVTIQNQMTQGGVRGHE